VDGAQREDEAARRRVGQDRVFAGRTRVCVSYRTPRSWRLGERARVGRRCTPRPAAARQRTMRCLPACLSVRQRHGREACGTCRALTGLAVPQTTQAGGAGAGGRALLAAAPCTAVAPGGGASSLAVAYAAPDASRPALHCFDVAADSSCGAASAASCCFAKPAAVKLASLLVPGAQGWPRRALAGAGTGLKRAWRMREAGHHRRPRGPRGDGSCELGTCTPLHDLEGASCAGELAGGVGRGTDALPACMYAVYSGAGAGGRAGAGPARPSGGGCEPLPPSARAHAGTPACTTKEARAALKWTLGAKAVKPKAAAGGGFLIALKSLKPAGTGGRVCVDASAAPAGCRDLPGLCGGASCAVTLTTASFARAPAFGSSAKGKACCALRASVPPPVQGARAVGAHSRGSPLPRAGAARCPNQSPRGRPRSVPRRLRRRRRRRLPQVRPRDGRRRPHAEPALHRVHWQHGRRGGGRFLLRRLPRHRPTRRGSHGLR
jgi:hypothetical protein